jgi:hypothetical protein
MNTRETYGPGGTKGEIMDAEKSGNEATGAARKGLSWRGVG